MTRPAFMNNRKAGISDTGFDDHSIINGEDYGALLLFQLPWGQDEEEL